MIKQKFHISIGQELKPDRQALYSLFIALLLSISPHLGRLPAGFAILAIVVFGWRYKIISANWRPPGSILRIIIIFSVLSLLFQHYHTLLGRDAGVAMLVALTMLKFLELKTMRDYMLVVFLCLFIVLTSFLYSQSLWLGVYLMAVVIILFTVMMFLNHSNREKPFIMLKRAAGMVMMGLPVAILLFLLFPRLQGGLFGLPGDSHSGLTGMSDTMKPGSINELNLSEKVAFRVEFNGRIPVAKQRYWRGLVLENYEQGVWKESRSAIAGGEAISYAKESVIEYSILQEPSNQKWIFALDMPVSKPPEIKWGTGQTLRSTSPIRERQQRQMISAIDYKFTKISDEVLQRNFDKSSVNGDRLVRLAEELYRQAGSDREYIKAVFDYYRNNEFFYTLKPPLLGDNPVQTFMLDTRKGYCEHYASSFTAMMRLAGIPARVIIGYQGGEWNEQGGYLIVRQSDAHAWSEVWLEESGWTRVDPTSAVAPERIEYGLSAIRQLMEQGQPLGNVAAEKLQEILSGSFFSRSIKGVKLFWDGVNTRWYKWVIDYGTKNQSNLLRWLGFQQTDWSKLVFILVGLVSLVVVFQAWILFRREKVIDPAVRQYQRFCHRLSRIGIDRSSSEGPARFARRVIHLRPDLQSRVMSVTDAYIAILYAGKTDAGQQQKLTRAVQEFRPGHGT
ncbi:MAG: DUF3488 and transglutaminase-like domain-containing protein [Pseudomonadota bacterium]|nr:DUF3488 and transglutaminase-like domain-containing protein [Pseudomonadota bacterium]